MPDYGKQQRTGEMSGALLFCVKKCRMRLFTGAIILAVQNAIYNPGFNPRPAKNQRGNRHDDGKPWNHGLSGEKHNADNNSDKSDDKCGSGEIF